MKYCKIITPKGVNSVTDKIENIPSYLEDAEPGDVWIIEAVEMTEEQFEELQEFIGF